MLERYKIFCEQTREFWEMNVNFPDNDVYIKATSLDGEKVRTAYTHYKSGIKKQGNGYFKIFYVEFKNTGKVVFYNRKALKKEIKDYEKQLDNVDINLFFC